MVRTGFLQKLVNSPPIARGKGAVYGLASSNRSSSAAHQCLSAKDPLIDQRDTDDGHCLLANDLWAVGCRPAVVASSRKMMRVTKTAWDALPRFTV